MFCSSYRSVLLTYENKNVTKKTIKRKIYEFYSVKNFMNTKIIKHIEESKIGFINK